MRDLDWKIISTLHTYKNITKTADMLFIAQPTLTKRIQLIEEELGVNIIMRNSKGVIFTPEGDYVAERAKQILSLIDDVKLNLSNLSGGQKGTLHIGVPNSYARFVFPAIIENFSKKYPDIKLDISTALSSDIIKQLENREINIGFARGNFSTSLEKILLSEDQIYIVNNTPIDMEKLPDMPQIEYTKEPSIIKATEIWWKQHFEKPPYIRMTVNHGDTCLAMIKHNLGYGIFSDKNFFKHDKSLFSIPLIYNDGTKFTRKTHLFYHKDEAYNQLVNNFINFIKELDFDSI